MADAETGTGNDVTVNSGSISHYSREIDVVVGELQRSRGQLESAASEMRAGWTGEAAEQFSRGAGTANLNLDRLIQSLRNLNELLTMSKDGFVAEEHEQAAQMKSALAGLETNPNILQA